MPTDALDGLRDYPELRRMVEASRSLSPVTVAVAYPCDEVSLLGALEAADMGLIVPHLVGPRADRTQSGSRCEPDWVRESALIQIDRADSRGQWDPFLDPIDRDRL